MEDEKRKPVTVNIKPSVKSAGEHAAIDAQLTFGQFVEASILAFVRSKRKPAA
jgi:hypothetical protein